MRTLTIKRSKWVRGILNGSSCLLNEDGNMCCLGFEAKAVGFPVKWLKDSGTPEDMNFKDKTRAIEKAPHLLRFSESGSGYVEDTRFVNSAVDINDNQDISELKRENDLAELFELQGIIVDFID